MKHDKEFIYWGVSVATQIRKCKSANFSDWLRLQICTLALSTLLDRRKRKRKRKKRHVPADTRLSMPRLSERQLLLQDLEAGLELQSFYDILAAQSRIEMAILRGVSPLLVLNAVPFAGNAHLFFSYLALNGVTVKNEILPLSLPDLWHWSYHPDHPPARE